VIEQITMNLTADSAEVIRTEEFLLAAADIKPW
jgi:hypothetical protein